MKAQLFFLAWALLCAVPLAAAEEPARPNVVVFLVDDLGWLDTSVPLAEEPGPTNLRYHTPHIAALAEEGMRFTDAYAYAVCSPSRVSLMTGINAAGHKVTNWTLHKDTATDSRPPSVDLPVWNMNGLAPRHGTPYTVVARPLPEYLRKVGYRTIHVGKAHWGAAGTPGADPLNLGFDVNIAGHAAGAPGSYYGEDNFARKGNDPVWDVPGLEAYHGQDIFLTEALTREAIGAVDDAVEAGKPFFLYLAHYAVHTPLQKDPRFYQQYIDEGLSPEEATYASMIAGTDKSLGDLRAHLAERGLAENTVIIFTSDNGQFRGVPRNRPLRGHKANPYEGGIRVPLFVLWPGVTTPGSSSAVPIHVDDHFPTVLELAHARERVPPDGHVDGRSYAPLLRGDAPPDGDRLLVWHFPNSHSDQIEPYSAARKGPWKLIYWHAAQRYELYNLAKDIAEAHDLAAQDPARVRGLADLLGDYLARVRADMPRDRETGETLPYITAEFAESAAADLPPVRGDLPEGPNYLETTARF